jgi:tripartite-type tricarboxylate transporter receptor subunit TctC
MFTYTQYCREAADYKGIMKRFLLVLILLAAPSVLAQNWPSKPIRWIVPYSPGGATDIATRPLAERVGQARGGHSGLVENRAGASGHNGVEAAVKSAPDGYTLLGAVDALASNPQLFKLSWDPFRDSCR